MGSVQKKMEVNKSNGYSFELFNNHNVSPVKTEFANRQNVSFRRRCRSECLQMTPIIGIPIEIPNKIYETRSHFTNMLSKPNIRRSSTTEKRNMNEKRLVNKDHIKENLKSKSAKSYGPEIYDIRESYIREIELLKDRPTNISSQKLSESQTSLDQFNHKNSLHSELYKRRIRTRTRSESEPHEIYNSKPNNTFDNNVRDDVSIIKLNM